jgi:voltage-gated potassium channel
MAAMTTPVGTRVAGQPRSPEDAVALASFDQRFAFPLVLAAILPLVFVPGDERSALAATVAVVSWIVFLVDFVEHERRLLHYLRTWLGRFDLVVVILTAPWFLILGPSEAKFVMVIRLARVARLAMATKGARRLFQRLGRVALVAALVVVFGAAVAYGAEHKTNPDFATFGDAPWWGIVTLSTVGYGDIVPKTTTGRVAGIMIMLTGIAVLGLLAGSLASFFRLEPASPTGEAPESETDDTPRLAALTHQISTLQDQVAHLTRVITSGGSTGGSDPGRPPSERDATP